MSLIEQLWLQNQRTALHIAAEKGYTSSVEYLCRNGSDIKLRDKVNILFKMVAVIMTWTCVFTPVWMIHVWILILWIVIRVSDREQIENCYHSFVNQSDRHIEAYRHLFAYSSIVLQFSVISLHIFSPQKFAWSQIGKCRVSELHPLSYIMNTST